MSDDLISRQAAIDAFMTSTSDVDRAHWCKCILERLPSAQLLTVEHALTEEEIKNIKQKIAETPIVLFPSAEPEWNIHTVACLLAELFDDDCACNYNGIDEWLPSKCESLDSCPHPGGVACWEQFLKHRKERRGEENEE